MPTKIFQIVEWDGHFENNKSRPIDKCQFVCLPNKRGMGLKRLLARENGPAIFGCFVLVAQACSRQPKPRAGWLTDGGSPDGRAWDVDDIALETGIARDIAEQMLVAVCDARIGWMRVVDSPDPPQARDFAVRPQQGQAAPPDYGVSGAHNVSAESKPTPDVNDVTPVCRPSDVQVTPQCPEGMKEGMKEGRQRAQGPPTVRPEVNSNLSEAGIAVMLEIGLEPFIHKSEDKARFCGLVDAYGRETVLEAVARARRRRMNGERNPVPNSPGLVTWIEKPCAEIDSQKQLGGQAAREVKDYFNDP